MKLKKIRKLASNVWLVRDEAGEVRYAIYGKNNEFMAGGEGHRDEVDATRAFRQLTVVVLRAAAEFAGG